MGIGHVVVTDDVTSHDTTTVAGAEVSRELASALTTVLGLIEQGVLDAGTLTGDARLAGL